jgi:gliding-associated putative ABC transporter substrate-binding component GldG
MTRKQVVIITALSIIAFILALMVSGRVWFRLDLTKNKAYTISKVSRNLHKEISDPVNITYYLSNKLKTIVPAPGEIEDTLREFAAYSKGKIRLTVRDPIKAGVSRVDELGLQPRQVQTVEQDQASLVTVYSGIVIEYLDKLDVLPWVISTDTLEYDLTSRIRSLINDSERWIGALIGDSFRKWREDFGYLEMTLAEAGYRVRQISMGDEIPENMPALFVLGGAEDMDDWALYRIDRYIQQGGKVLFAVKGVYIDTVYGSVEARLHPNPGLLDMIASYGVIIRQELALDRNALTLQYQTRSQTGAVQYKIMRYPLWIGVSGESGNALHPVSSGFTGRDVYWASPLELAPPPSVEAVSLFTSSPQAWLMRDAFYTSPEIPYMLEIEANETRGEQILGAALSGTFPSFFRESSKPEREGSDEELPDMPENARQSRIIVIGDTDFATNMINVTQARHNLDFLLRAADWLANDDDIIGIRSRQPQTGRFDKISDPVSRAAVMKITQIINVGLIPLLVIISGIIIAYKRKTRNVTQSVAHGAAQSVTQGVTQGVRKPNAQNTEIKSAQENTDDV